jgi:hypothetical protein
MIGTFIGSILAMQVFSLLFEWAIFKRLMDDPVAGKVASLFTAWAFAAIIYAADSNGRGAFPILIYGAGALIVLPYKIWGGMKVRQRIADADYDFADKDVSSLNDTFS